MCCVLFCKADDRVKHATNMHLYQLISFSLLFILIVPVLTIFEAESQQELNPPIELTKVGRVLRITLKTPLSLKGDVRVILKNKPNVIMLKEKMFHFWFNTYFVKDQTHPPSPSPSSRRTLNEKNDLTSNGLDSTASMTKAEGLALKNRFIGSLIERPEHSGSYPTNHLSPNLVLLSSSSRCVFSRLVDVTTCVLMLLFSFRASSLNSVYSENSSAPTSEPNQWLSVTLMKRELDKACKDSNHKIFPSDFKASHLSSIQLSCKNFLFIYPLLKKIDDIVLHSSWTGAFEHRWKFTEYGFRCPG